MSYFVEDGYCKFCGSTEPYGSPGGKMVMCCAERVKLHDWTSANIDKWQAEDAERRSEAEEQLKETA